MCFVKCDMCCDVMCYVMMWRVRCGMCDVLVWRRIVLKTAHLLLLQIGKCSIKATLYKKRRI